MRRWFCALLLALVAVVGAPATAAVAQSDTATQAPTKAEKCNTDSGVPVVGPAVDAAVDGVCKANGALQTAERVVEDPLGAGSDAVVGGVLGEVSGSVGEGAAWVTGEVAKAIDTTTTPELTASWYRERYASMVALGVGFAALVAMIAIGSAALRRDPEAMAATLVGIFRAGIGTGLVIALTAMALGVSDSVTNAVAPRSS